MFILAQSKEHNVKEKDLPSLLTFVFGQPVAIESLNAMSKCKLQFEVMSCQLSVDNSNTSTCSVSKVFRAESERLSLSPKRYKTAKFYQPTAHR